MDEQNGNVAWLDDDELSCKRCNTGVRVHALFVYSDRYSFAAVVTSR